MFKDLKVGDTVYWVNSNCHGNDLTLTVTKIGRKYFTVRRYGNDTQFDLETGYEKLDGNSSRVYWSQESYEQEVLARTQANRVREYFIKGKGYEMTMEQSTAIMKILGIS